MTNVPPVCEGAARNVSFPEPDFVSATGSLPVSVSAAETTMSEALMNASSPEAPPEVIVPLVIERTPCPDGTRTLPSDPPRRSVPPARSSLRAEVSANLSVLTATAEDSSVMSPVEVLLSCTLLVGPFAMTAGEPTGVV